jgi:hypothetical protein
VIAEPWAGALDQARVDRARGKERPVECGDDVCGYDVCGCEGAWALHNGDGECVASGRTRPVEAVDCDAGAPARWQAFTGSTTAIPPRAAYFAGPLPGRPGPLGLPGKIGGPGSDPRLVAWLEGRA